MKYNLTTTVVIAVIAIAAGFFAGIKYQSSKTVANTGSRGQFTAGANRGGAGLRNGGGQVTGTILSTDSSTMTLKLQDGSSKIIILSGSTSINKMATGSNSDLTVGTRVGVFGTTNTDGSVTATNVQINPAQRGATPSATPSK